MNMPFNYDKLDTPIKELINKNPDNLITRNVLRKLGYAIPNTVIGRENLIECLNSLPTATKVNNILPSQRTNTTATPPRETLSVDISYSEVEYGHCNYSVRRSGENTVRVPINVIRDSILEDDYSLITDYINDHLDRNYEDYDDYEYNGHDYTDSDNYEDDIDISKAEYLWESYMDTYGDPRTDEDEDE